MDPEEERPEDRQGSRPSARGGAGEEKPMGVSFQRALSLDRTVWSVSLVAIRGTTAPI